MKDASIRVGTSAFTAAGWDGAFYPAGMKPADHLSYFATKFDKVEVDSTFYRTPSVATVNGWARKVPNGFLLAAKNPQHDQRPQEQRANAAQKAYADEIKQMVKQTEKDRKRKDTQ